MPQYKPHNCTLGRSYCAVSWRKLRCRQNGTTEGSLSFREAMGKGWCMAADHLRAWAATACTKNVCASLFWTQRRALLHPAQTGPEAPCICLEDLKLFIAVLVVNCNQFRCLRSIWRRETLPFRVGIPAITYHIMI